MSISQKCLWALGFDPSKKRLTIYPLRGKLLTFRRKEELDWFIEQLIDRSRLWYQEEEQNPEEAVFLDLGLSNEQKRSQLRRGLLFGKRKRRR